MTDAKLGTLVAEIVVDGGYRSHYGARDAITGKIVLEYRHYSSFLKSKKATADFFGPIELAVFLRGKIKILIKQERDIAREHGGPLFLHEVGVHSGPFTSKAEEKHEFPFSIRFPESAGGEPLPPSFSYSFQEFPDAIDLTVIYRLGVRINVPGIDIKTVVPEHYKQPEIVYDHPRVSKTRLNTAIKRSIERSTVKTQMLLPEEERPQGFQQKLKAVFAPSPTFSCEISCTELQHLWRGYRPSFTINIRRSDDTALSFPDATLIQFRADLVAYTWCDSSKRLKGPFERMDSSTIQRLTCGTTLPVPLTKANDYSTTLTTDAVKACPTSFTHSLLVRRHFVKIKMKLKIAQESVGITREFEVKMVPLPFDTDQTERRVEAAYASAAPPPPYGDPEAGPSTPAYTPRVESWDMSPGSSG